MDSQKKRILTSEESNVSKPISAWERRKLYSKQMYDKYRNGRNLENKTSTVQKVDSGKQSEKSRSATRVNSKVTKRKLSLVKDESSLKENNQPEKRHKTKRGRDSLFPKKKTPPKRNWQNSSNGKENFKPKTSSFSVRRTSPKTHSFHIPVEKDTLTEPSMPKLRRSASFTIDKGSSETKPLEEENTIEGSAVEIQNALNKSNHEITVIATTNKVSIPETNISVESQDNIISTTCSTIKNVKQNSKPKPTQKTPLKLNRRASLLVKKDRFVKPAHFSGKKVNRREQLMTWKQQQDNKPATINNRRVTCGPSILGSSRQFTGKQVAFKVNQLKNRRTLSSADNLGIEKVTGISKPSSAAISSKTHEQRNSSRLSLYQRKKESALNLPINKKQSPRISRKSCSSNALPKFTVAANVERTVAHLKMPIETQSSRKSILKSGSTKKIRRSVAKRKSLIINQQPGNRIEKDTVSENLDNDIAADSGISDSAEQLKYNSVDEGITSEKKTDIVEKLKPDSMDEVTSEEKTDNNVITETKESATTQQPNNDLSTNDTPLAAVKDLVSSRKKSVCFDISLRRSTPGKALPKTPKRDFTLRERLQLWLDNKGHSISSFRHVRCFGYHLSNVKPKKSLRKSHDKSDITPEPETAAPGIGESPILRTRLSEEANLCPTEDSNFDFDVNEVLTELKVLLANSHPIRDITEWLDELVKFLPAVEENPQYWICRSLVAELRNGVNGAIAVYHEALDKKVQCSQEENETKTYTAEICKALDNLLRRYAENFQNNLGQPRTPHRERKLREKIHVDTPREPLLDKKNMFNSTVIKYGVSYSTPGSYRSSVKAVVTPVRRSARLSCTPIPRTSNTLLNSLTDLPQNIKKDILIRENDALVPNEAKFL